MGETQRERGHKDTFGEVLGREVEVKHRRVACCAVWSFAGAFLISGVDCKNKCFFGHVNIKGDG